MRRFINNYSSIKEKNYFAQIFFNITYIFNNTFNINHIVQALDDGIFQMQI